MGLQGKSLDQSRNPASAHYQKRNRHTIHDNLNFDEKPRDKLNAKVLSKEKNREVKETVSELYNMLWTWLIDDNGQNILFDENDDERFPDFGLYVHIAAHCKNAVPKEQLKRKLFEKYIIKKYPDDIKIYSLYV